MQLQSHDAQKSTSAIYSDSPLLRILSSKTSVCPLGIFLLKTWAERRNMASTAEPFSRAIWSSWSRDRKPAQRRQMSQCKQSIKATLLTKTISWIPGMFFVNSTNTWTWLVAISVRRRKFSSVLYCSCSWRKRQKQGFTWPDMNLKREPFPPVYYCK